MDNYPEIVTIFGTSRKRHQFFSRIYYGMSFREQRNFEEFGKWIQTKGSGCRHGILFKYPVGGDDRFILDKSSVSSLVVSGNEITIMPVDRAENERYLDAYDARLKVQEKLFQKIIKNIIVNIMIKRRKTVFEHFNVKVVLPSFDE